MAVQYFSRRARSCWRVDCKTLPIGANAEFTGDCWILELHLINDGPNTATVSVYDGQNPPCPIVPTQTLSPGGMISLESPIYGRYSVGGVFVNTSTTGTYLWMLGECAAS